MSRERVSFRVSAALKSIIGKDLITNDQVAIFELVKNSYDANATEVKITFNNIYDQSAATIIIEDNGIGMGVDDIREKWLFVAYSEKKPNTRDQSPLDNEPRIHTSNSRAYAGAKGIGRFACDRLGRRLQLTSVSKSNINKEQILDVDWGKFEDNDLQEFANIMVDHQEIEASRRWYGTKLVISDLNATWDRRAVVALRKELAKLISPAQLNSDQLIFNISIICKDEIHDDEQLFEKHPEYKQQNKLVNGIIVNPLFNVLVPKTIRVTSRCIYSAEYARNIIHTKIIDRGVELASFEELSDYSFLDKTNIDLYYVNRSAKILFKRFMGDDLVRYGSTLVYKNNIRILPFGKPDDDSFGLDKRKGQGTRRHLGTRDLFGIISITDGYQIFTETSSRDGGFIENSALSQLKDYVMRVVKILEKYVIDISDWGIDGEEFDNFRDSESKIKFAKYIDSMSRDTKFVNVDINTLVRKLTESNDSDTALGLINAIRREASETGMENIGKNAEIVKQKVVEAIKAKESAEADFVALENKTKQLENQALFLRSNIDNSVTALKSYHHQVFITISDVNMYIKDIERFFRASANDQMIDTVREIQKSLAKINAFTSIALNANFSYESETIEQDMAIFIAEYLNTKRHRLPVQVRVDKGVTFVTEFEISDIMIILDNLISNSKKAKATWIRFEISTISNGLKIVVTDNGVGIKNEIVENIFTYGFTTHEDGTGIGLSHVSEIVAKYSGSIKALPEENGAKFLIYIGEKHGS